MINENTSQNEYKINVFCSVEKKSSLSQEIRWIYSEGMSTPLGLSNALILGNFANCSFIFTIFVLLYLQFFFYCIRSNRYK